MLRTLETVNGQPIAPKTASVDLSAFGYLRKVLNLALDLTSQFFHVLQSVEYTPIKTFISEHKQ